jgi:hypothetical protein
MIQMTKTYYLKHHLIAGEVLVAICDKEIINLKIKHNNANIFVNERFYGTDEYYKDEVLLEIRKATQINVIGKNIVELLIENNFLKPQIVLWFEHEKFGKIGHALLMGGFDVK